MSETKPLTMSAEQEEMMRADSLGSPFKLAAWGEVDALRAALAEAQRDRAEVNDAMAFVLGAIKAATGEEPVVIFVPELLERWRRKELAAAQLNARTLREALAKYGIHEPDCNLSRDPFALRESCNCGYVAALSAPADEAALRQWGDDLIRAFAKGRMIEVGAAETRPYLDAALGAPETHAKEG